MMKRTLVCVILFWALALSGQQIESIEGFWIPMHLTWTKAPANVDRNLATTYARVLYFGADGSLGVMDCTINRENNVLTISNGDARIVFAGKWKTARGKYDLLFSRKDQTIDRIPPDKNPEQRQSARFNREALVLGSKTYEHAVLSNGDEQFHNFVRAEKPVGHH
jgi:hypothetical protein